jgi:hypothetical protein
MGRFLDWSYEANARTKQAQNGPFHHMTVGPFVSGLTSSRATTRPHLRLFSTARLLFPRLIVSAFLYCTGFNPAVAEFAGNHPMACCRLADGC